MRYIKLFESIEKWEWYTNQNTKSVFLHCLIKASWNDFVWKGMDIKKGSFPTSYKKLALELGLTESKVKSSISHLILTGELTKKVTNDKTVITVINWAKYQCTDSDVSKDNDKQVDGEISSESFENRREIATTKKYRTKEVKNKDLILRVGSVFESYSNGNNELLTALTNFDEMRKAIKKPMTDKARQMVCTGIDGLIAKGESPIDCINQSIMNNWLTVYPMSKKQKRNDREDVLPVYEDKTTVSDEEKEKLKERIKALKGK